MIRLRLRTVMGHFSIYEPLDELIPALNAFRPDVISSYGSHLSALLADVYATGRPFHRPAAIVFVSDALSDEVRRLASEQMGIEVLGIYQAVESPMIGFECERHSGYHLNVDLCPVRIVDPEGRDVPEGESGNVVISNLVARGTMLINYAMNDIARRIPGACACGRSLPLLSEVEGRISDWIETASGDPIHVQALRMLLRDDDILRYQQVQERPGSAQILIVPIPGRDTERIRERIEGRMSELHEPLDLELSFVETLPQTPHGKVRAVVRATEASR